jgi:hypothetical protein
MSTAALSWYNNCLNPRLFVACGGFRYGRDRNPSRNTSTRRDGECIKSRFCKVVSGDGNNMLSKGKAKARGGFHAGAQPSCKSRTSRVKTVTKFRCQRSPEPGPMNICLWFHPPPSLCIHSFAIYLAECAYLCHGNADYLQLTRTAYMFFLPCDCAPQHASACFVYFSLGV